MVIEKSQSSTYLVSLGLFIGLVFLSGEALVAYGVFSGLVMATGLVLAFCMIALLARHFDHRISTLFKRRFSPLDQRLLQGVGSLVKFELLIIEGLAIGRFGVFLFDVPFLLTLVILYSVCCAVALLINHGAKQFERLQTFKLAVYFPLVILFPVYAFLQKSPENVYHNLLHYNPWFLHLQHDGLGLLLPAIVIIGYGKLNLLLIESHQALLPNRKKTLRRFGVAVAVWAAGILAFSATALVAISEKVPVERPSLLVIELIQKISAPFILIIFCCSLLLIAVSTVIPLLVKLELGMRIAFRMRDSFTKGKGILVVCLIAIACTRWIESSGLSILDFMLIFGILDGSVGVTLTLICLSDRLKMGNWSIWSYPALSIIGVFLMLNWLPQPHYVVGVLLSSGITLLLICLHSLGSYLYWGKKEKIV